MYIHLWALYVYADTHLHALIYHATLTQARVTFKKGTLIEKMAP